MLLLLPWLIKSFDYEVNRSGGEREAVSKGKGRGGGGLTYLCVAPHVNQKQNKLFPYMQTDNGQDLSAFNVK